MIDLLKSLLRICARPLLPFMGWRVPVRLLCGTAPVSGREVRLLAAGNPRWSTYLVQRFFAGEPVVEKSVRVPVWSLRRQLEAWKPEADLTLIGIDNLSARLFLPQQRLTLPPLVSCWGEVSADLPASARHSEGLQSDLRRVRKQRFGREYSTSLADFHLFYDRFYAPYIRARHGKDVQVAPRWMLRLVHSRGGIMWVTREGERLAGDIVLRQGRDFVPVVTGLQDAREDLLRQGAMAALYVLSQEQADAMGCTRMLLGGCRPSLHDGVLRYKSKWLSGLMAHDGFFSANHAIHLGWNRLAGPVAEFLSRCGLIHHEAGGFSALWAFPADQPLTAKNLQRHYRALKLRGLHRLRILLPGPALADFAPPPEVRLLTLEEAESADLAAKHS